MKTQATSEIDFARIPIEAVRLSEGNLIELFPASEDGKTRPLSVLLSAGTLIRNHYFWGNFVLDLEGFSPERASVPVLREHDIERVIGYTTGFQKTKAGIQVDAVLITSEPEAQKVANLSDANYPWQASPYWVPKKIEEVVKGGKAAVNGREIEGPAYIMRQWSVREVTVCTLGLDEFTEARAMSAGGGEPLPLAPKPLPPHAPKPLPLAPSPQSGEGERKRQTTIKIASRLRLVIH
jgi:hypothetical protein